MLSTEVGLLKLLQLSIGERSVVVVVVFYRLCGTVSWRQEGRQEGGRETGREEERRGMRVGRRKKVMGGR